MKALLPALLFILLIGCQSSDTSTKAIPGECATMADSLSTNLLSMDDLRLNDLKLPDGFKIELYGRVDNARSIAMSPSGTLFVSNRRSGGVYALRDTDGDFKADEIYKLASDLKMPNGVTFNNGSLYVAEVSKLWRYPDIEKNLCNPTAELIYDDFPTDSHHGWKYIAFGPDGKLYVPVGAPCNICETKEDTYYASIVRMDADGTNREVFARGVRNTVGFTWHPKTGEMWFTDNGRDALGDDTPNCELNRVTESGQHFGYPYCHGGDVSDPEFGDKFSCDEFVAPAQKLGPHVAPLGVKFYTGSMFPEMYQNLIFIAEHGSWNRTPEAGHTGHKVTLVAEENGKGVSYESFMDGFLDPTTNEAWGRPVDLLFLKDGSMLLSDDKAGAVYRITYGE